MSQYEQLDTTAQQKGGVLRSAALLVESISKTVLSKYVGCADLNVRHNDSHCLIILTSAPPVIWFLFYRSCSLCLAFPHSHWMVGNTFQNIGLIKQ